MGFDRKTIGSLLIVVMTSPMALFALINWLGPIYGIAAFVAYVFAQSWLLKKFWQVLERK